MEDQVEKSREEKIREIGQRLVKININPQLEVAAETLEFLRLVEEKQEGDLNNIKKQETLFSYLSGEEYAKDLSAVFEDKLGMLSDAHLDQYLETLLYEEAVADMNIHIAAEISAIQNRVLDLHFPKTTMEA